jgi:hypothetical protein
LTKPKVRQLSADSARPQYVGPGRVPTPNRAFYRQTDDTRLYTTKYVQQLKDQAEHSTRKFFHMADARIRRMTKEVMSKARTYMEKSHAAFTAEFEKETKVMLG